MNIIVCIKQVPDTTEVKINPETSTLIREGVPSIVNPFDMYAIEEGLRLKEQFGGKVTVISMGPPQAREALKEAVAMGADEAILLSDRAFAGSDTWATAYTLSQAISKLGAFDVILCGKQAIDGDTGQVGPGIARQLSISQLTYVFKIRKLDPAGAHGRRGASAGGGARSGRDAACPPCSPWSRTSTSRATPRSWASAAPPRWRSRSGALLICRRQMPASWD